MSISFEQIRAFVAVAETGSFSGAAKALNKHRTTLGEQIANLELELNMALFDRSGRYPQLTEDGAALYQQARTLSESAKAFETLYKNREQGIESDVTVYHSDMVPNDLIVRAMSLLRRKYAHVRVHWSVRTREEARQALRDGKCELGIFLVPKGNALTSMKFSYLANIPFVVVANSDFVSNLSSVSIEVLRNQQQLIGGSSVDSGLQETLSLSSNVEIIDNPTLLASLLAAGEGWAILPQHQIQPLLKESNLQVLELGELNSSLRYPICIWRGQSKPGPVLEELLLILQDIGKEYE